MKGSIDCVCQSDATAARPTRALMCLKLSCARRRARWLNVANEKSRASCERKEARRREGKQKGRCSGMARNRLYGVRRLLR